MSPRSRTWARISTILPKPENRSLRRTATMMALALVVPLTPVLTLAASPANAATDSISKVADVVGEGRRRSRLQGAGLLQDRRLPARRDPRGHRRRSSSSAPDNDFTVDATEDGAAFTDANLAQYAGRRLLSTTGDVLDADQQAAFERYIQAGGGFAGVHAASDTEYDWAWYGKLVGAYFKSTRPSSRRRSRSRTPPTRRPRSLPTAWTRTDEWYNFQTNPRGTVHVLASPGRDDLHAGTGAMGADHPIAWCQDYDGGRSWYTGLGHTKESLRRPELPEASARRHPDGRRRREGRLQRHR